jgi:hypothetical protein
MTDTVRLRPETRPVSLFLAVQHGMLRILKRARCSLLHSVAEKFMVAAEFGARRYSHDSQDLLKLTPGCRRDGIIRFGACYGYICEGPSLPQKN